MEMQMTGGLRSSCVYLSNIQSGLVRLYAVASSARNNSSPRAALIFSERKASRARAGGLLPLLAKTLNSVSALSRYTLVPISPALVAFFQRTIQSTAIASTNGK